MTCADQFRVLAFAPLTYRESLRDIEVSLSAQAAKLYHMGFRHEIKRSTLADANETRDRRIHAEFAQCLITQARKLYIGDSFGNLRGNIPHFIHLSDGKLGDVKILDVLALETGAFYVMDRGYLDFGRLYARHQTQAFFVTRAKSNTQLRRVYSKRLLRTPTPSMTISIRQPLGMASVPNEVPQAIKSPGCKVMSCDKRLTICRGRMNMSATG